MFREGQPHETDNIHAWWDDCFITNKPDSYTCVVKAVTDFSVLGETPPSRSDLWAKALQVKKLQEADKEFQCN